MEASIDIRFGCCVDMSFGNPFPAHLDGNLQLTGGSVNLGGGGGGARGGAPASRDGSRPMRSATSGARLSTAGGGAMNVPVARINDIFNKLASAAKYGMEKNIHITISAADLLAVFKSISDGHQDATSQHVLSKLLDQINILIQGIIAKLPEENLEIKWQDGNLNEVVSHFDVAKTAQDVTNHFEAAAKFLETPTDKRTVAVFPVGNKSTVTTTDDSS
jgi:hypothetical protein